ncbi:hypothetical protein K488DRAFT_80620 [Vararia minispora EC-137]|uniref:Uncharacterized protein n=1 Tax=Vararia minispora EC-137 TaxID=1314806 RepID=A0ACB8QBB5_9AGAM|nr:hypothetical protein K488DRAFT_80620 [Vararia minispora EC-137]
MTLLKESAAPHVAEEDKDVSPPFRFSTSPAPSRGTTPAPAPTTRRALTSNPNGTLRATGAGSARRNRYQSPSFGPPRSTPNRLKLSPPRASMADTKRRRVDESGASEPAGSPAKGAASESSAMNGDTTAANGNPTTTNGSAPNGAALEMPATPRPRHARIPGAAAPAESPPQNRALSNSTASGSAFGSPAKVGLNGAESPAKSLNGSPAKTPNGSPARTPTKAAAVMADLIKQTAPPKKPDVANPYEAALPARISGARKRKAEVRRKEEREAEREREKGRKEEEDRKKREEEEQRMKEDQKEPSAQQVIEATLPPGSRRARPPAHMQKGVPAPPQIEPRRSARLRSPEPAPPPPTITVVEDEDDVPSKKRKMASSASASSTNIFPSSTPASTASVVVEEVPPSAGSVSRPSEVLEPGDAPAPPPAGMRAKFGARPREPSKLRFGFAAEEDEKEKEKEAEVAKGAANTAKAAESKTAPEALTSALEPPMSAFGVPKAPFFSSTTPPDITIPVAGPSDPKATARALAPSTLPTFAFDVPSSSKPSPAHAAMYEAARTAPTDSLPAFAFVVVSVAGPSKATSVETKQAGGFDWAAAGMKKPAVPASGGWTCGTCMLSNPADAVECTVCEAKRPGAAGGSRSGFNWAAAGLKKPAVPVSGNWTCGTCMLSNPADAPECTVCEAKRPGAASAASAGGFDWAAAGMKRPEAGKGSWTCGMCMVNNGAERTDCVACEAKRP